MLQLIPILILFAFFVPHMVVLVLLLVGSFCVYANVGAARSYRIIALCYGIHGVFVGGVCLLWAFLGLQGARSHEQVNAILAAGFLQPAPMFITALALWLGRQWASPLTLFLLAFIAISYLVRPSNAANPNPEPFFRFYFGSFQAANFPGATVLALVTAGFLLRDAVLANSEAPHS